MTLAFYLDDNVERRALAKELERRSVDVLRATDAGYHAALDEVHLAFATSVGRVVVTSDEDFHSIHWAWVAQQRMHAGIVMVAPDMSIGERVAGLCALNDTYTKELVRNQLIFLRQWVR
ncbi:MAG TPA: DUF5615 family PIN-like protein [Tepidiformaceae bacterium]|nr:DUF5615 family PIN-like protein [Tepidiformaceae bacterium]